MTVIAGYVDREGGRVHLAADSAAVAGDAAKPWICRAVPAALGGPCCGPEDERTPRHDLCGPPLVRLVGFVDLLRPDLPTGGDQ